MNPAWIDAVVDALLRSQTVPFPGGHGTVYETARQACLPYRDAPGLAARCVVVLGILADTEVLSPQERFKVVQDWPFRVMDWFSQRGLEWPASRVERALYMLHAMERVVGDWAAGRPGAGQPAAAAAAAAKLAAQQALQSAAQGYGPGRHGLLMQQYPSRCLIPQTRWDRAFEVLNGPKPDLALALLFLHLLHATLGIRAPTPDLPNLQPEGRAFYDRVVGLLGHVRCQHRDLAQSIGATIGQTALLRGRDATLRLTPAAAELPLCFGTSTGNPLPDLTLALAMVGYGEAAALLKNTEWLATTVTNSIIDTLHLRPAAGVPGFTAAHCGWLVANATRLPGLYTALRDGRLPRLAQRYLGLAHDGHWADHGPDDKPCALCHVETA